MITLLTKIFNSSKFPIKPITQLKRHKNKWLSVGYDPQFFVIPAKKWKNYSGWQALKIIIETELPLNARLYFDTGEGFKEPLSISFLLTGRAERIVPIFIPDNLRRLRLDPCDTPAVFRLSIEDMFQLNEAPTLSEEFRSQIHVYKLLGAGDVEAGGDPAGRLLPMHQIDALEEKAYQWRSTGVDPWFIIGDMMNRLQSAWYSLELCISSNVERGNAKFYFDYGEGFMEFASIVIPFNSNAPVSRLVHLQKIPQAIRFDPLECEGKFSIHFVHFTPVGSQLVLNRMFRYICTHDTQINNNLPKDALQSLCLEAQNKQVKLKNLIVQKYSDSFITYNTQKRPYEDWIEQVETPVFTDRGTIATDLRQFHKPPTISVVMPTYNTPENFLRQAIDSVLQQSYPYWELCIADDASTEPWVRPLLEAYNKQDQRIKVLYREKNGHISAATNSALSLASGDFVAFMDHDDELATHALHFVAKAINQQPSAQVLYSDEDKIDEEGQRSQPHFKSDWNPDLFLAQNYVSHLCVYRHQLLQDVGGLRLGVEGSQDHDLLLRCLLKINPADIVHIPKVLYHWRKVSGSTALAADEKKYTTDAGIKALKHYFAAQGQTQVRVEAGPGPGTYRIQYPIPRPEPTVTLLIPTRDMLVVLEPCIRSILEKTTYPSFEIVIIDNQSLEHKTLDFFKTIQQEDSRVRILPYPYSFNYSAINNFGVQQSTGDLIGLINNDIEVITPEWLTELVSHAIRPEIGCVGAKLYFDNDTIQHAGVITGLGGVAGHSHRYFPRNAQGYFYRLKLVQNLSAVTAACLVVRRSIYLEVGGLEEEGLRIAFNDVDFCLKVREAGYRNLWTPYAELYHHESKSRGAEDTPEKVARFNKEIEFIKHKWGVKLLSDPYYSPNLTLHYENFSIG